MNVFIGRSNMENHTRQRWPRLFGAPILINYDDIFIVIIIITIIIVIIAIIIMIKIGLKRAEVGVTAGICAQLILDAKPGHFGYGVQRPLRPSFQVSLLRLSKTL